MAVWVESFGNIKTFPVQLDGGNLPNTAITLTYGMEVEMSESHDFIISDIQ